MGKEQKDRLPTAHESVRGVPHTVWFPFMAILGRNPFFLSVSLAELSIYMSTWVSHYAFKEYHPAGPVPSMPPRRSTNQSSIRLATYTALSILSSWLLTAFTAISEFKKFRNKEETVARQSNHVQSFASSDWQPFNFNVLHGWHFGSKGAYEDLCLSGWTSSWKVVVRPVTPLTCPKFPGNKSLSTFGGGNHPKHYQRVEEWCRCLSCSVPVSCSISWLSFQGSMNWYDCCVM